MQQYVTTSESVVFIQSLKCYMFIYEKIYVGPMYAFYFINSIHPQYEAGIMNMAKEVNAVPLELVSSTRAFKLIFR